MKLSSLLAIAGAFVAGATLALTVAASPRAQDAAGQGAAPPFTKEDMEKAMAQMSKMIAPGPHHKELERFLGSWKTTTRFVMGGNKTPGESGTATVSWLMDGRWLKFDLTGAMMKRPYTGFVMMGYDNFKRSFVSTSVTSIDTAMVRLEGDMDPSGKSLLMYGTLDEYTTGEHDKMVKYVYRFESADRMVLEVHDLPIGESNTQVVEVVFERAS
jgi:hypothetical protein